MKRKILILGYDYENVFLNIQRKTDVECLFCSINIDDMLAAVSENNINAIFCPAFGLNDDFLRTAVELSSKVLVVFIVETIIIVSHIEQLVKQYPNIYMLLVPFCADMIIKFFNNVFNRIGSRSSLSLFLLHIRAAALIRMIKSIHTASRHTGR